MGAGRIVAGLLALVAASSAMAGQPGPNFLFDNGLPPQADNGKAQPYTPPPDTAPRQGCLPALPCGTRLLGKVQRNGAVELRVPALRW